MSDKKNYFVCTLGEAGTDSNEGGSPGGEFQDVNHLIDTQAKQHPDFPAVGFYKVQSTTKQTTAVALPLEAEVLTFDQVHCSVLYAAEALSATLNSSSGSVVGLLCSSSPQFLFAWLGCIRLGKPVLLIAPECTPVGIASLCQSCEVSEILTDEKHADLGKEASQQHQDEFSEKLASHLIPFGDEPVFKHARSNIEPQSEAGHAVKDTDIAYIHHTSGTSSGKPKPIPQSHRGAVEALPSLDGRNKATFTTTPMYHGGPADTFRAWTSSAMIWLFPSQSLPITASNVMRCLDCSHHASEGQEAPRIKYFASVPYVLQMMGASEEGLRWLLSMDLVGVGGAALPKQAGDELVEKGVRLVSRFGSAECGFLLSSHRNYDNDVDWQYLRQSRAKGASTLKFENRDEGLSELVVPSTWPQMAKRNRDDGSYATSDLFEPHPSIPNAWRYHSRADSQLTLITGKKFDPAPIESSLVASTSLLDDALVFGNDKPYPGVLLFRSKAAADLNDGDLLEQVSTIVGRMNEQAQSHAQIPDGMLVPFPFMADPLPKSSKGTILRGKAEEMYASHIGNAYENTDSQQDGKMCSDEELPGEISRLIETVIPKISGLDRYDDLFSSGVDSVAGTRIRSQLHRFLPKECSPLPVNIVERCPSIDQLSEYIVAARKGKNSSKDIAEEDVSAEMWRLVDEYGDFHDGTSNAVNGHTLSDPRRGDQSGQEQKEEVIVLTGATGALGANVLHRLRNTPHVARIYCLVRGADTHAAKERISKALGQRQLPSLSSPTSSGTEIVVLKASLSDSRLGLSPETYERVASETTTIMHLAWSVNFRMQLRSFAKDSISGLRNLLDLALASPQIATCPRFLYCSSVASAADFNETLVPEKIINDPTAASGLGYSQSKWVAEQICVRASQHPRLADRVSIFRVGQLSGDSTTGVWNSKEAWPLMLSSVSLTGALPDLGDEALDWLPVDIGAEAMVQGINASDSEKRETEMRDGSTKVFHVLNDHTSPTWRDLLDWLKKKETFEIPPPREWVERLERAAQNQPNHPAMQLLDHWKTAFRDTTQVAEPGTIRKRFAMEQSKKALPVLQTVQPVTEEYFERLWTWIRTNMS